MKLTKDMVGKKVTRADWDADFFEVLYVGDSWMLCRAANGEETPFPAEGTQWNPYELIEPQS